MRTATYIPTRAHAFMLSDSIKNFTDSYGFENTLYHDFSIINSDGKDLAFILGCHHRMLSAVVDSYRDKNFILLDTAAKGNVLTHWRFCVNDTWPTAYMGSMDCPSDRWDALGVKLKAPKFKKSGKLNIIFAQESEDVYRFFRMGNRNKMAVYLHNKVVEHYPDATFYYRVKEKIEEPLRNTLLKNDIDLVISHSSNSAFDALTCGVPALVLGNHPASLISMNKIEDLDNIRFPEPDILRQWCYNLAYTQFSTIEIQNGFAWEHTKQFLKGANNVTGS
jgi:hypothetical protein